MIQDGRMNRNSDLNNKERKKKRNIHKKVMAAAAVAGASFILAAAVLGAETEQYTGTDFAMDTVVSETLYTSGKDLNPEIGDMLRETEEKYLSWTEKGSETYKINQAKGKTVQVSDTLAGYLEKALKLAEDSGGAFDPTMGKVIRLWDIGGENPHVPDQKELDRFLEETGYENLILEGNEVTLKGGAALDLGAAGKGIGCDIVMDFLKNQKEVCGMILNLGGSSVMAYGKKPDQTPWRVALRDPREEESGYLGVITLKGGEFLSTSGDYEKYFMEDGKRYHHILDPETGYPVWNGLTSVTVICENGLLADGLSTACFVLGAEDALPLLEKYNAEAAFVDEEHNIYLTDGMKSRFELMKNTYTIRDSFD